LKQKGIREAKIHFELHRHLQNAIEKGVKYRDVTFARSEPEYDENLGGLFADIVVFDKKDRPWLVIEAKKKIPGGYTRDIDPYSPKVIRQAFEYAGRLGTPYFATYNGDILVLFETFNEFKPLLQSKSKSYRITNMAEFACSLLQDVVALRYHDKKWDKLDDAFVSRAKHFHERILPFYFTSFHTALKKDKKFNKDFVKWAKEQGFDMKNKSKEVEEGFAKQGAYILLNQLLFYKILENSTAYKEKIIKLDPVRRIEELPKILEKSFESVIKNIDFEAVFKPDLIFGRVKISTEIAEIVNEFIEELRDYDLSVFDSDVIGRIYEQLIPIEERRALGQYYTPPPIIELIVKLCIQNPDDKIFDPACGSGGFLVKAYGYLKELHKDFDKEETHEKILSQIYGNDINRFPAHLSAINLAVQDISRKSENVQVEVSDFFDIKPSQGRFARRISTMNESNKKEETVTIPNRVNVVVANPPYIRRKRMENIEKNRSHLNGLRIQTLSRWCDIYCYFFTHSYEFLEENGKLGFITSDRWLFAEYGKGMQKFFLDKFKINAVIAFDTQSFEEPLISTCISILEKSSDQNIKNKNFVKFIRVKRRMDVNAIIELVNEEANSNKLRENKTYRIASIQQSNLENERWSKLLYAPRIYFDLIESPKITKLSGVADITIGITSGVNEFFYLTDEQIAEFGLKKQYFKPLMKSQGQADFIEFGKKDTEWRVLNIHSLIEKVLNSAERKLEGRSDLSIAGQVKSELKKKGYKDLAKYIELGEERDFHNGDVVSSRRIWFDLGILDSPPLIFPVEYWKKSFVFVNKDGVNIDKHLFSIHPKKNVDLEVLAGILNSDLLLLVIEIHGRLASGEALARNEVWVNDAKGLPILDPKQLNEKEKERIKNAFTKLLENGKNASEAKLKQLRTNLNKAVLAPLGMADRVEELEKSVTDLLNIRIRAGGTSREVIIEDEKPQMIELKGAKVISSKMKSLDDYN